jgi:GT2 family glycosyltransferase
MPVEIDIIILSYAKNEALTKLTEQTIATLLTTEDSEAIKFNVLVIESNKAIKPFQFANSTTIYPEDNFGFNKYLNIGVNATNSPYIGLCNNDLVFHKGWASEILKAFEQNSKIMSANPYGGDAYYFKEVVEGPNVMLRSKNPNANGVLTGWCILVKRVIFNTIGPLDEQFEFWYADNDYDRTLKKYRVEHALVKTAIVEHVAMQSHDALDDKEKYTHGQKEKFDKKWNSVPTLKKFLHQLKGSLKK